jgi:hypothetical protein
MCVIEGRQDTSLSFETSQPFRIRDEQGGKNLERHLTLQPDIAGAVHFPHAAGAERADDLVPTDSCTRRPRHSRAL